MCSITSINMLTSLSILYSVICMLLVFYIVKRRKQHRFPPGPNGLPFVGYLPFMGKNPAVTYMDLAKKYGSVFSISIGTRPVIILSDNDTIYEALVERGTDFSGRPQLYVIDMATKGYGVLFRDHNEIYKTQIRFTQATIKNLKKRNAEKKISDEISHFLEVVESNKEKSFDCKDIVTKATCNIICQIFMNIRYEYEDERFLKIINVFTRALMDNRYKVCFSLLTFMPALRHFQPFSKAYKTSLDDTEDVIDIVSEIVREHKKNLDSENPRDFIDEYLIKIQQTTEENSTFDERQLCELVREMFIGGMAPISITVRWIILCFAHFPEIQEKIFCEAREVIGKDSPLMDHKKKMPYTSAFLQEITRHRTVVPTGVPHSPIADVKFRDFDLPKGTPVFTNIWAAHHDPKYFNNPDEFNPERFLDDEGKFMLSDRVMPYGIGSRRCVAGDMGMMAIFLLMINVVQKFKVIPSDEQALPDFHEGVVGNAYAPGHFKAAFISR